MTTRRTTSPNPQYPHEQISAPTTFDRWECTLDLQTLSQQERDDDYIVGFFTRWANFGGGDEVEIMTRFGIDKHCYLSRLKALALSPRLKRYPDTIQKLLLKLIESPPKAA